MTVGTQLNIAISETAVSTDRCKACQRKGLPILPLRHALVPRSRDEQTRPDTVQTDTRMGLRTLRAGYLYVLLDRSIWQAYQVTPDGYLRQFNPYEPAPANEAALSDACVSAHHDGPASFLNIDTDKHTTAWLAFASDPWPASVLDGYKAGRAPERFQKLDLASARDNPASVGLAMNTENLQVDKQVYEYQAHKTAASSAVLALNPPVKDWRFYEHSQQVHTPSFSSVYGFYSRVHRVGALKGFVIGAIATHKLQQGVLAFVLDDTFGLVQEYNGLRNGWIETRQQWMNEPERAYKYQTSQLLLAIRVVNRETADNQTPPAVEPVSGDGPPDFSSPEVQRERLVRQRTLSANEALEERYDEQARALFHRLYEEEWANYQRYIDQSAHAYAAACRSQQFVRIEQHDYDGANRPSGLAYCQTMARCLEGGISEAPPPQDEDLRTQNPPADTGPTASLWSDWLKNPQSPVYRALLVRDKRLLADLLPSFDAETDEIEWNDTEKLYSTVVALIGSDEFKHSVRPHLQLAIAQLLGALNSAGARLQPVLSPGVARVVSRLNSAVQLLYNGVHLTQLKVTMTLGQYYALQSKYLRSLQQKAADAIDRTWESAKDKLGEIDHEARQARKQVRPIIQNGLLSLAVLNPKIADHAVTISVWVEGKVTELQDTLMRQANLGVDHLGRRAHTLLVNVTVGLGTLDPQTRKLLQGLKTSTQQAAHWVRTGFTGLRGVAASSELLLAIGGLYFASDSLKKNIEEAEKAIGDKSDEARLALYGSSLGVLGGGIEVVGIALEKGAEQAQKIGGLSARASAAAKATAHAGNIVIRVGGSISAVSGLYDATQAGFAASRSSKGGDATAASRYVFSATVSGIGAGFGIWAAATGATALLGPLGIALLLGLAGYALFKWAEGEESTALERWTRRCYFGYHNETPPIHWDKPEHAAMAIAELNAATMGVEAGVNFSLRLVETDSPGNMGKSSAILKRQLEYRLVLPLFDAERSAYRWSLTVHRHGDGAVDQYTGGEVVAQGNLNPPGLATPASKRQTALAVPKLPKKPDYQANSATPTLNIRTVTSADARTLQVKDIKGAIQLLPDSRRHNIEAATLSLTYWPNRDILDAYAELTIMDHQ